MKKLLILVSLIMIMGCATTTSEELQAAKQLSADYHQELGQLRSELVFMEDPIERAKIEGMIAQIEKVVKLLDASIQKAQTVGDVGWGILETVVGLIGGPALLALPVIRMIRRNRANLKTIFRSIHIGGGPVTPEAAKSVLVANPAAYAEFKKFKAANNL